MLPTPLTSLVGRETEIAEILALLDDPVARLVTLLGPGGVGKTRLAIEVAASLEADYAHGACFVALASIREPELVPGAVARALGLLESGARPAPELVTSALRDRHLLLVLDNLEHLVDGAAQWVNELVTSCPRLTVLLTSRHALNFTSEHRYLVPPLPLPAPDESHAVETIANHAAVALFLERARAVRPGFELSESNAGAVSGICRKLDGVPLAIELAAVRINVLTPAMLLDRLTHQLSVLTAGGRGRPERHQTMATAIGWSYDLLADSEQRLFRRLCVFVGGVSLDAAESVGTHVEGEPVLDLVESLVDHSLIHQVDGIGDDASFMMLEPIREFGLERLAEQHETEPARDAHADYFLRLGADAWKEFRGPDQLTWLQRIERTHDNFHAAFRWLIERGRIHEALDLAHHLQFFRTVKGHWSEGETLLAELLALPKAQERTPARGKGLMAAGSIALNQGNLEMARRWQEEAVSIFRELGDRQLESKGLSGLAFTLLRLDELGDATDACMAALEIAEELRDAAQISVVHAILGWIARWAGETDAAISHHELALSLFREMDDRWGTALSLFNLADFKIDQGDLDGAEELIGEGLRTFNEVGDKRLLADAQVTLARIARLRGDFTEAAEALDRGLEGFREIGGRVEIGWCLYGQGKLAIEQGDHRRALRALTESVQIFANMGTAIEVADGLDEFARIAVQSCDMVQAARFLGASGSLRESAGVVRLFGEYRDNRDSCMAASRAALGDATFGDAWSAGKALTLDAAVTDALAYVPSRVTSHSEPDKASRPAAAKDLTPREFDVLRLLVDGLTNQEIADVLYVSPRTAATHIEHILTKLDARSRTAAVAYAIRNGLV